MAKVLERTSIVFAVCAAKAVVAIGIAGIFVALAA